MTAANSKFLGASYFIPSTLTEVFFLTSTLHYTKQGFGQNDIVIAFESNN